MRKYIFVFSTTLFVPLLVGAHAGEDDFTHHEMMNGFGWGMTSGVGSFFSWVFALTWIVWLIVGVLAAVWLWKQIQKK